VLAVSLGSAGEAAGLVRGRRSRAITILVADEVVVDADSATVPVGVDGEALSLPTPVRCAIRPGALRVRVPRSRPGARPTRPPVDWRRLSRLALSAGR
jgi:diacylglycerol kinase family enzyme